MWKPLRVALTATLGGALAVGAAPLVPSAAVAAPPELQEVQKLGSGAARNSARGIDLTGDYAATTNRVGASVDIAHRAGAGEWQTTTIPAPEADAQFGEAVAFDDTAERVFISAPHRQSVYVYERSGENDWALQRTLEAPSKPKRVADYGDGDRNFGEALDFSEGTLAVGVPNARVDGEIHTGMVFAVDVDAGDDPRWTPLIPENPIGYSITGQSVAIDGDHLAVSAIQNREDHAGVKAARVGGLYLWDLAAGGEPRFTSMPKNDEKVCLSNAGSGGTFGVSMSFFDGRLAVGSPHEITYTADSAAQGCANAAFERGETTQGAVYFFDTELNQLGGKLTPTAQSRSFGFSTVVDGSTLYAYSDHAPKYTGEVHAFDLDALTLEGTGDENFRQRAEPVQTLAASDASPKQLFGYQMYGQGLRASDDRLLVGSTQTGAAYLFESRPEDESGAIAPHASGAGAAMKPAARAAQAVPAMASVSDAVDPDEELGEIEAVEGGIEVEPSGPQVQGAPEVERSEEAQADKTRPVTVFGRLRGTSPNRPVTGTVWLYWGDLFICETPLVDGLWSCLWETAPIGETVTFTVKYRGNYAPKEFTFDAYIPPRDEVPGESDAEADAGADAAAEADAAADADEGADAGADSDAGAVADAGSDADAGSSAGAGADAEGGADSAGPGKPEPEGADPDSKQPESPYPTQPEPESGDKNPGDQNPGDKNPGAQAKKPASLAQTGAGPVWTIAAAGAVALLAGVALLLARRRGNESENEG